MDVFAPSPEQAIPKQRIFSRLQLVLTKTSHNSENSFYAFGAAASLSPGRRLMRMPTSPSRPGT
jgi:hypothetical protein